MRRVIIESPFAGMNPEELQESISEARPVDESSFDGVPTEEIVGYLRHCQKHLARLRHALQIAARNFRRLRDRQYVPRPAWHPWTERAAEVFGRNILVAQNVISDRRKAEKAARISAASAPSAPAPIASQGKGARFDRHIALCVRFVDVAKASLDADTFGRLMRLAYGSADDSAEVTP